MPENHIKITLSVNQDTDRIIKAKQFDAASRYLDVTLVNDDGTAFDLTDCRVQFNAQKADLKYIMNDAVITDPAAGKFTIELTDQTLAIGNSVVNADISIFSLDGIHILTTRSFGIEVQATVRNDTATESSNEYNSVVILFQDVWDMRETIREINERFGQLDDDLEPEDEQAGSSALGGINRMWNYLQTQSTAAVAEMVSDIKTLLGRANPTSSNKTTVMNYLRLIEDLNNRGAIKSIQKFNVKADVATQNVTMSSVNVNKSIIVLASAHATQFLTVLGATITNSTTVTVNGTATAAASEGFRFQVVEFY